MQKSGMFEELELTEIKKIAKEWGCDEGEIYESEGIHVLSIFTHYMIE